MGMDAATRTTWPIAPNARQPDSTWPLGSSQRLRWWA